MAPAEPPAIEAALGAPAAERPAAPRKTAARKQPAARRTTRKAEGGGQAPVVHTTINPNYAWPFADAERA